MAVTAVVLSTALGTSAAWAAPGTSRITQVSQGDPAASCTAGAESGHLYPNAETEPFVAVNPWNPRQAIGTWQQDRWSNGGSHVGGETYTHDGVHYTERTLPFGVCAGPGASDYERISDLWVSWGPDGAAYSSALQFDAGSNRNGVGAATTFDGGATWKYAQPVIADNDPAVGNDKNSVTADPTRPGWAYQAWDRIVQPFDASGNATSFDGPGLISITHDHGRTWTKPAVLVDTAAVPFSQTIGNVIVANAWTGTLYDFFDFITYNDANNDAVVDVHYGYVKSVDGGATWSKPQRIAPDTSVSEVDPNDPTNPAKSLRAGGGLPNVAIDPVTGELYLAYEGSDFSGGAFDQIELVHSTDGGKTWSAPSLVSQDPNSPAFTPSIAVDWLGTVHISYYDVRHLMPGNTTTLPASTWLLSFPPGRQHDATETQIAPDFDWLQAPFAGGHMLGDYEGLATDGVFGVRPIFVTTANAPGDPSDVFTGVFHGPFSAPVATAAPRPHTAPLVPTHAARKWNR
jgi:hypothetical protein